MAALWKNSLPKRQIDSQSNVHMFGNDSWTPVRKQCSAVEVNLKANFLIPLLKPLLLRVKLQNCTSLSARSCSKSYGYASIRRLMELSQIDSEVRSKIWCKNPKKFLTMVQAISRFLNALKSFKIRCTSHAVDNCQKYAGAKLVSRWQIRVCVCRFPFEPNMYINRDTKIRVAKTSDVAKIPTQPMQ